MEITGNEEKSGEIKGNQGKSREIKGNHQTWQIGEPIHGSYIV